MRSSVLTSKGQITIPKGIRDRLALGEGDSVVFDLRDNEIVIKKDERRTIMSLSGIAKGRRPRKAGR